MKKLLLVVFVFCLSAINIKAQKVPTFADYPAKVGKTTSKQPNLASHKNARMFRTNLRNAANEGINFAGNFVITYWGCGTSCAQGALIDARTGKIFFPTILEGMGAGFCDLPENAELLEFKPDSRLLILSGFKGTEQNREDGKCGIYYFEWTGSTFRQIKFIQKKSTM